MPLYEYQCEACGIRFERQQNFSDEPVKVCPECGGEVHRLIYPVGVIFKGKGFYVTDNRKAKSSTAVSKAKEKSKTSEKSGATGEGSTKSENGAKND
jgi:putative FmdB family regulatory protein